MKVLVTGGAGFIGSHLVEGLLRRGDSPIVVDNLSTGKKENLPTGVPFYPVDIRDKAALEEIFARERPEFVSHHAAQTDVRRSMADPAFDADVNVLGLVHLLSLCVKYKVKKVAFASSSAVYPEPQSVPADENHPVAPVSAYGLSKYIGEQYVRFFAQAYGLHAAIFRYGNVYGPRQDPEGEAGVVAIFATQMLKGIQPTLYGDGNKTRDYIYVDDVVSANLLVLNGSSGTEVFNLGWGQEIRDCEVFEAIRKVLGVRVEPRYALKRPGELDRIALESRKARTQLRWTPRVPFEEGIRRSVAFYRQWSS